MYVSILARGLPQTSTDVHKQPVCTYTITETYTTTHIHKPGLIYTDQQMQKTGKDGCEEDGEFSANPRQLPGSVYLMGSAHFQDKRLYSLAPRQ